MTLKKGDKVWRVVPGHGDKPALLSRELASISDKQIRLVAYFPFLAGLHFPPRDLGRVFHATPEAAVEAFEKNAAAGVQRAESLLRSAMTSYAEAHAWAAEWRLSARKAIP